jgi:mycothiol synthase
MKPTLRNYRGEDDFWRVRRFLQEVFLLNNRLEHSWHVARWEYLRWHMIENCHVCGPLEEVASIWETPDGQIVAVVNPIESDEAFIHIHPHFRTADLEAEIITHAEQTFRTTYPDGHRRLYVPVDEDDHFRKDVLARLGYDGRGRNGWEHYHDLTLPLPEAPTPPGYTVRSMGDVDEHPARNWCSWQAFHANEPVENFDPDWSWYANLQRCPLYRRDLDVVAVTPEGEIAAFCTALYDDATRSAVTKLVGTAAPHWRRGLGKALQFECFRRLHRLGCTRVFAKADDENADLFYSSTMTERLISETWFKDYTS